MAVTAVAVGSKYVHDTMCRVNAKARHTIRVDINTPNSKNLLTIKFATQASLPSLSDEYNDRPKTVCQSNKGRISCLQDMEEFYKFCV